MYEIFRLLHSNSGFQGPQPMGFAQELLRRINRTGGPLEAYQHRKTVVRSLERIPRIRKLKFGKAARNSGILHLGYDLILILNPDSSPDGPSIVSHFRPESKILPRGSRIRNHPQLFNIKRLKSISIWVN